jgi:hypothetical protein
MSMSTMAIALRLAGVFGIKRVGVLSKCSSDVSASNSQMLFRVRGDLALDPFNHH